MLFIQRLIWDSWNVAHIARHGVTPDEATEVCFGSPFVEEGHSGRLLIIGPTAKARMLSVILNPQPEEGVYYVVTARPAARKERRVYQREKGGE